MDEFFPSGITHYVVGSALIGVGVAFIFVLTETRAGASGVLSAAFGLFSQREVFVPQCLIEVVRRDYNRRIPPC